MTVEVGNCYGCRDKSHQYSWEHLLTLNLFSDSVVFICLGPITVGYYADSVELNLLPDEYAFPRSMATNESAHPLSRTVCGVSSFGGSIRRV